MDCIIGVNIASNDSLDFSCVSAMCKNCNSIIYTKLFIVREPDVSHIKTCPQCGVEFTNIKRIK